MDISEIFTVIRIFGYTVVCIMCLWRFVYLSQVRWLSISVAMVFFILIILAGGRIYGINVDSVRNIQTLFVAQLAIAISVTNYIDYKRARLNRGI